MSNTRQILIEARQLLVDKGWVPECGSYTFDGPNCVMSAISVVAHNILNEDYFRPMLVIRGVTKAQNLPAWNDSQISIEPILEAFDKAIASLEE